MKKIKKALISLLALLTAVAPVCVSAVQPGESAAVTSETPYKSYTYWEDYDNRDKIPAYSKPMYEVSQVVAGETLKTSDESKINDVATDKNGNVYLLDGGISKIYKLNSDYSLADCFEKPVFKGEELDFNGARGIFVSRDGKIYVADTENGRVLVMDSNGKVEAVLTLPDSELIPSDFSYRPIKVTVDSKGYTYVACDGSYYGALLYSPESEFLGFFGANTVKATVTDVLKKLWKKLTSNDIKRAADEISLPYTFTDMVVDSNDFILTATGRSEDSDGTIQTGQIARLNPGGKNVLNADSYNFADYAVGSLKRVRQIQDLSLLDVDGDGFFYALDTTDGRIFWYDKECNPIGVFAGSFGDGNQKGTFELPSGIAVNGTDVLVSDSQKNSLTVFKVTEYGALVRGAQKKTVDDDFVSALDDWETVISYDSNSQLAYRGLAKAYYDLGDNGKAMEYARLGADRETYADAFKTLRTEKAEKYFGLIFAGILLLCGLTVFVCIYKKRHAIKLIRNRKLATALSSVAHPSESFRLVKEKNMGSVGVSTVILLLLYVITVLNDTSGGFAFTRFDTNNYNAVYVLFSTVGLVVLWTVCNRLVCTLASGIGSMKEIYCVTCYSLIPILFARLCRLLLTHVLVPDEAAFLSVLTVACTLYAAFMLIIGIMKIHDYEFGKFVGTSIFTVIGMIILVFIIFLIFLLSQQVLGWIKTLYIETVYR